MQKPEATRWVLATALMLSVIAVSTTLAFAQNEPSLDAGRKIRDGGAAHGAGYGSSSYRSSRSAGTYMQSASDGCQGLYQYSYTAPAIAPPVAKRESEDIGKNVEAAKKELGIVRKEAAANKAIIAKLDAIEKHLAAAMDHHKMMHEVCCKDQVDGEKSADCCSDMITELEKAQAEQRALMRLLNPPKPVAPPKPATADKADK